MSDCLMAERRHRYNQHVSQRRHIGFPRIGHADTWRIDTLQLLVEENHGVLLHPDWSNVSDYVSTAKRFGTVGIHSKELGDAIHAIRDPDNTPYKLVCTCMYVCMRREKFRSVIRYIYIHI